MNLHALKIKQAQKMAYPSINQSLTEIEILKGCLPCICPEPVDLEPPYTPLFSVFPEKVVTIPETGYYSDELVRFGIWISSEQKSKWDYSEAFLKSLQWCKHRIIFEVFGNRENIKIEIACHGDDSEFVQTAFAGQFKQCFLSNEEQSWSDTIVDDKEVGIRFYDFFPHPPYTHLFTQPLEQKQTIFKTLFAGLERIPKENIGFYQVVFKPANKMCNWHANVEILQDMEYQYKASKGIIHPQQHALQNPSGALNLMATELQCKAHNDKPFFFVCLRLGIIGNKNKSLGLESICPVTGLFLHGGRALQYISQDDYIQTHPHNVLKEMIQLGHTYRNGFLLNSFELATLVHVPPIESLEDFEDIYSPLEHLIGKNLHKEGISLGYCKVANENKDIKINQPARRCHIHMIGLPGKGKSTQEEQMIYQDIAQGHGVAVFDPHGTLVSNILTGIADKDMERVVYFEPSNLNYVPLLNPLIMPAGIEPSFVADSISQAIQGISRGWGDRVDHLLRHAVLGMFEITSTPTLFDLSLVLSRKSNEGDKLRKYIVNNAKDPLVKHFWKSEFAGYSSNDLHPPQHKLSKLLMAGTAGKIFVQKDSNISFFEMMKSGSIFLADLSRLGKEVTSTIGCLLLSMIYVATMHRRAIPFEQWKPFHVYLDEGHYFATENLGDIIAETRKFNISLTIAHQWYRQFNSPDALLSCGNMIAFGINESDAIQASKCLLGQVSPDDLMNLGIGEAIVKIGSDISFVHTLPPNENLDSDNIYKIMSQSQSKYCLLKDEINVSDWLTVNSKDHYLNCDFQYDEF